MVDRRMSAGFDYFRFQGPMPSFQFRKMRCYGHYSRSPEFRMGGGAPTRFSVAIAIVRPAPIETVVYPPLHHLNAAVTQGESVAGEEPSRNSKCPIIEPQIVILHL